MKGDPDLLTLLNECLTAELTAINQYYVHYKMCENWGYHGVAKQKREEAMDEMKDADKLMERILYLEGIPNMRRLNTVSIGEDVKEMHEADLELERGNVERLNRGIALARDKGDNGTRTLLEHILVGEEEAVDKLEAELHVIEEIGLKRYLSEKLDD